MEQPNRILVAIVGAEAVRANELCQAIGLVSGRHVARTAHFGQAHAEAARGELPCSLAPGEPLPSELGLAQEYGISREEVDAYALRTQQAYAAGLERGVFEPRPGCVPSRSGFARVRRVGLARGLERSERR